MAVNSLQSADVQLRSCLCTHVELIEWSRKRPVWARERCRISPPRFLAECCKRQLNQVSFVLLYFRLFTFSDLYWVYLYFPVLFCLSVSVKWLAVKTASEMTYTLSSGALNSTPTNQGLENSIHCWRFLIQKMWLHVFWVVAHVFSNTGWQEGNLAHRKFCQSSSVLIHI